MSTTYLFPPGKYTIKSAAPDAEVVITLKESPRARKMLKECQLDREHWNPRYTAYAAEQNHTEEEQLRFDEQKYPGGKMCGFILWIAEHRRAFAKAHPEAMCGDSVADHNAWDKWLGVPPAPGKARK